MSGLLGGIEGATEGRVRILARKVEEIANAMDDSETACADCGHAIWNDRDEYEIARSLRGIGAKLDNMADRIRGVIKKRRENTPTTGA